MGKNYVTYGDAETLMSGLADKIEHLTFTGTQAEWNALTETEKKKYSVANITDDESGTGAYPKTYIYETPAREVYVPNIEQYEMVIVTLQLREGTEFNGAHEIYRGIAKFRSDSSASSYVNTFDWSTGRIYTSEDNIIIKAVRCFTANQLNATVI